MFTLFFLFFYYLLFLQNQTADQDQNWEKRWPLPGRNWGQISTRCWGILEEGAKPDAFWISPNWAYSAGRHGRPHVGPCSWCLVVVVIVAGSECHVQCNNPKTKEPKLDAAVRIIPEWISRDAEIRRLWDSVYTQPSSSSASSLGNATNTLHMHQIIMSQWCRGMWGAFTSVNFWLWENCRKIFLSENFSLFGAKNPILQIFWVKSWNPGYL